MITGLLILLVKTPRFVWRFAETEPVAITKTVVSLATQLCTSGWLGEEVTNSWP